MTNLKKLFLLLLALAALCMLVACSDDDDDDTGAGAKTTVKAELPESVGKNNFEGKTWKNDTCTWIFTNSTAKEIEEYEIKEYEIEESGSEESVSSFSETSNYRYSYDSENKLLYLLLVSYEIDDTTISSEDEYIEFMKNEHEYDGGEFNERDKVEAKSDAKDSFEILTIYEYSIDSDGSLTLKEYFSGSLPTFIQFRESDDTRSSSFVNLTLDGSTLKIKSTSDNSKTYIFLNYSNGSFSGTAVTEGTILEPTVTGTYSVSGAGISDSSVTLKFTALPREITEISNLRTNTEYELSQNDPGETSRTYTLSN